MVFQLLERLKMVHISLVSVYIVCQVWKTFAASNILDMTHDFATDETLYWPGAKPFKLTIEVRGELENGFYCEANSFCASEHGGTHLEAPSHFARNASRIGEVLLDRLIGEAVVIDVSENVAKNRDYQCKVKDFTKWEAANGKIPDGTILLLHTGWGKHWPNQLSYFGTTSLDTSKLHFPGLHPRAAKWITSKRNIKLVGIDAPSVDHGQSRFFEANRLFAEKEIPLIVNVANMEKLPLKGATVYAIPMKIREGSGAPVRLFAVLKEEQQNCKEENEGDTYSASTSVLSSRLLSLLTITVIYLGWL